MKFCGLQKNFSDFQNFTLVGSSFSLIFSLLETSPLLLLLLPQITVIEHELLSSQDEVHEVMQALEELAVSYDTKDREMGAVYNEKQLLTQENERIQVRAFSEGVGKERERERDIFSSVGGKEHQFVIILYDPEAFDAKIHKL